MKEHKVRLNILQELQYADHDKFGWDRMDPEMQKLLLQKWSEILAPYPFEEVKTACIMHTQEQPDKVPNAGHIRAIVLRERRKLVAHQHKVPSLESPREVPSNEAKMAINELVKREFPQIKRFGGATL